MRLLLFLLCLCTLSAQEVVTLPAVTVSSATGEVISASVFGDGGSLLDTPRAYQSLSRTLLEAHNVSDIGALQSFDASVQTIGTYGHTATVNVRGDMAELYQNGQRRTDNAAGFQPSLNGVEQVDVVKGAAPVVFGPGFYSGGYLNMQTRRAEDASFTDTFATLGQLSADHSYLNVSAGFDLNRPGIRVDYMGRRDATFYHAGRDDAQDLYVALHHGNLDLFLQHSWEATPQIEGINRPDETLIETGLYAGDHGRVPLKATDNLVSLGDFSNSDDTVAQAIYAVDGFRASTLVEYVNRRRFNAFSYAEYVKQLTLDQRLEWHTETATTYTIAGLEARYEGRRSFTNYYNADFAAYDITLPGARDASQLPGYLLGSPGPGGRLFFGPLDGNTDTTLSNLYQFAPFVQQRLRWNDWQLLYGARLDAYRVFVTDPLTHSVSDSLTTHDGSATASLIRTFGAWSAYATVGRLYSVNGTVSGGGIVLAPDNRINPDNLRSPNTLYEVGVRHRDLTLTGFWQYRQQPDLYSYNPNDIVVRGVEADLSHSWGPIHVTVSGTYNEGNYRHSLPFEFAPTVSVAGDYRIPGLSRIYADSTLGYQGRHWSATVSARYHGEQEGDLVNAYHLPGQTVLDTTLGYRARQWSVTLNVGNLLNTWCWLHNGDLFSDNAVVHHEPLRNASLTFRYHL